MSWGDDLKGDELGGGNVAMILRLDSLPPAYPALGSRYNWLKVFTL